MTTPTPSSAADTPAPSLATTRACIKNLPPSFNETKLKSHLQSAGNKGPSLHITDCKLLKTKDGKSRKIAFVGFQTAAQAEYAVSYFDKSFAGTARLSVSLAFSKKKKGQDATDYRPWSKHSEGSSRYAKLQQEQEAKDENDTTKSKNLDDKEDMSNAKDGESEEVKRKREEFLSAMGLSSKSKPGKENNKASSKSKFWGNDDAIVEPGEKQQSDANANPSVVGPNDDNEGSNSESENDSDGSSSDSDSEDDDDDAAKDGEKKKPNNKIASDLDFLKSKQVKADILSDDDDDSSVPSSDSDDSSSDSDSSSSEDEDATATAKDTRGGKKIQSSGGSAIPEPSKNNAEQNRETTDTQQAITNNILIDRLFVRNLPFTTAEEDLHETFSQFGEVSSVHIPVDDSKRNKGYAFITYQSNADAKTAMESMDGADFQGRLIHILPARPSVDLSNADIDDPNLTYQQRQTLIKQKEAEKTSEGWSASFLRGDAVVDNLSDRLGVSKGEVLNVKDGISSGNAAVRLALGETHIISENIAFFEEHGVDVTALEGSKSKKRGGSSAGAPKRSKTMVLVKNLPYDTTLEDLTKVFHGIGGTVPTRMLLPPSKTAALVEYGHATDARRAFRRLAYKKFKHVPLYLEWAPMRAGGAKQVAPTQDAKKPDAPKQEIKDIVVKPGLAEEDPSTETADTGASQTIYVKNLNFSTSEDQLNKAFSKAGFQPRTAKIPTKAAPMKRNKASSAGDPSGNNDTRQVSMGFGFVEFPTEQDALKAMKALQGKVVDGHALEIKLSTKSLSSSKVPPADKSSKSTKIMVRNVPFEATRTELLQLFGSFGQLKKVRLPKKFDGTHRGFAFCEFVTSKEAQNAFASLSRTHLYGRHLVLEWASAAGDEDAKMDVDTAREKAKRDVMRAGLGGGGTGKKGKHLKF